MWAYEYSEAIGLEHLVRTERADPSPGPRQIVLRMLAFGLNYRDLAIAGGDYHVGVEPPLVPFSDGAGEVVSAGSDVTRFKTGDLACPVYLPDWISGPVRSEFGKRRLGGPSDGVFAEYVCLDENEAVRAPRNLDPTEAATLPVTAVTAWHQLFAAGSLCPGETLLVQGTGGISCAAVQLAKAGGVRVISLLRNMRNSDAVRALGTDEIVSADDEGWPKRVWALTDGRGADAAVNVAGGQTLDPTISALRVGGRLHLIGYSESTKAPLDIFNAIRHAVTIHVATAGSRDSFESLVRATEAGAIRPAVSATFAAPRFREALGALARGGHVGKVVLKV